MENKNQPILILDANAIILSSCLNELSQTHKILTTPQIIEEIRDKKVKEKLHTFTIEPLMPNMASKKAVKEFSQLTGDFSSLSDPDLNLIALAHTIVESRNLAGLLNKKPATIKENDVAQDQQVKNQANENELGYDDGANWTKWATQQSLQLAKSQEGQNKPNQINITVMTSDFAIQNVLLQMGIPVLAVNGLKISRTKLYVKECYACHRICRDNSKEFCPTCGNHALLRLTCSLDDAGNITVYRKKDFQINTKGLKFSIPKPRGGHQQNSILLREDEFLMGGRQQQMRRLQRNQEKDYTKAQINYSNGLDFTNIKHKAKHNKNIVYAYGKANINDPQVARRFKQH